MLAAGIGKPDLIEAGDLDKGEVLATARGLLKGVESLRRVERLARRSLSRRRAHRCAAYQAMWNYEAVIKETNDKLIADRQEPLYAIYLRTACRSPIRRSASSTRGRGKEVESFFNDLQAFCSRADTQARIARHRAPGRAGARRTASRGRRHQPQSRPPRHGGAAARARRHPEGAGDLPGGAAAAIAHRAVPRPSPAAWRARRARAARRHAVPADPGAHTARCWLQWSKQDQILVLPVYSDHVLWTARASGDDEQQAALLAKSLDLHAGGGTDFYTCGARALAAMKSTLDAGTHLPAIVIMTDGKSQGSLLDFEEAWRAGRPARAGLRRHLRDDADRSQLDNLARLTGGRVFDGTKSLMDRIPRRAGIQLNARHAVRDQLDRRRTGGGPPAAAAGDRRRHAVLDRRGDQRPGRRRGGRRAGAGASRSRSSTPAGRRAARSNSPASF